MKIKMKLHWQILSGLLAGALFGIFAATNHLSGFTHDWITPFGTLFVNLLKLIAMPLVFASLVTGVASLSDVSKLYLARPRCRHKDRQTECHLILQAVEHKHPAPSRSGH